MRRSVLLVFVCLAWVAVSGARARASSAEQLLTQAEGLALDAEFEASLALFDRLIERGELDRAARVRLLSERSLVLFALGQEAELDRNLRALAQLSPDARLSERAPPALLARWQAVATAARTVREAARESAAARPAAGLALQPVPRNADSGLTPRVRRALWITGAAVTATAVLITALALTLPADAGERTAVHPSVEF
ncbi:MAG TPA: hypothetical protein VFZ61_25710 [Polyangiales bacterium]